MGPFSQIKLNNFNIISHFYKTITSSLRGQKKAKYPCVTPHVIHQRLEHFHPLLALVTYETRSLIPAP